MVARLLPGIYIRDFITAVIVAAVYGIINFLLGTVLTVLTFPLVFITFGLFIFVINAVLLRITDKMVDDFEIDGFGTTIVAALLISVCDGLLNLIF